MIVGLGLRDHASAASGQRAVEAEGEQVAVDHAGGVDLTAQQRERGVALAADVIAMFAAERIEAADFEITAIDEVRRAYVMQGNQRRLWRIDCADAECPIAQVEEALHRAVGSRDDHRTKISVGIAHRHRLHRLAATPGEAIRTHPGQRRVPGEMDRAVELRLDLGFVVRIQDVVEASSRAHGTRP